MFRRIGSCLSIFPLLLSPLLNCQAAEATGRITYVWQHYQLPPPSGTNAFLFQLDAGVSAGCNNNRWAVDATRSEGKAVMATVFMAQATGKRLTVVGKGVCDVHYDAETVLYLVVLPN